MSVVFFPREKNHSGQKGASGFFFPTCHRKWWVVFFPQRGRRLPFWPEIDRNAYETNSFLHSRPESALAGLAAGRRARPAKVGVVFFPHPDFGEFQPQKLIN